MCIKHIFNTLIQKNCLHREYVISDAGVIVSFTELKNADSFRNITSDWLYEWVVESYTEPIH